MCHLNVNQRALPVNVVRWIYFWNWFQQFTGIFLQLFLWFCFYCYSQQNIGIFKLVCSPRAQSCIPYQRLRASLPRTLVKKLGLLTANILPKSLVRISLVHFAWRNPYKNFGKMIFLVHFAWWNPYQRLW